MNRDAFEQLVNEWLDDRERDVLRKRVDAVCGFDASLAALRDQYDRLDELIRALGNVAPAVDWERWRERVSAEIRGARSADATGDAVSSGESSASSVPHPEGGGTQYLCRDREGAGEPDLRRDREGADVPSLDAVVASTASDDETTLDAALAGLTGIDKRVDWSRLRGRISAAVDREERGEQSGFVRIRPLLYAASVLTAAAAVLLLAFWLPESPLNSTPTPSQTQTHTGFVRVVVHAPAETTSATGGFARVSIPKQTPINMDVERDVPDDDEPEVFLMVEPPDGLLAMAPATDGWR